jgi:hypothetical protein
MKFKRGDTFDFSSLVQVTEVGVPVVDFTGWTARSQIRAPGGALVADLTVTWVTRNPGSVRLVFTSTALWPIGSLSMDVEFVAPDGTVVSTETKTFTVVEDITR